MIYILALTTIVITFSNGILGAAPPAIEQPSCGVADANGVFPSFICKGESFSSRCFCCGPVSHSRIFGWSWMSSAENMTCACSRRRQELQRDDVSLHCTDEGNYEKLQCDDGLCWCADEKTGKPTERFFPKSMMTYLPCYSNTKYWRQCESQAMARLEVLKKLAAHGTFNSHIDMPICDDDGSYGLYRVTKSRIFCVWKDGKDVVPSFQSDVANIARTNCHCARDSMIYADENIEFWMGCDALGNYNNPQTSNGRPYCVDSDGYATSELGAIGDTLSC